MPLSGEPCDYSSVSLSPDFSYYVHDCLGVAVPESVLRDTETGDVLYMLEDNQELRDKLEEKAMPQVRLKKMIIF